MPDIDLGNLVAAAVRLQDDWQDIRGVLIRSRSELDWQHINTELTMLAELKQEPEIMEELTNLRNRLS